MCFERQQTAMRYLWRNINNNNDNRKNNKINDHKNNKNVQFSHLKCVPMPIDFMYNYEHSPSYWAAFDEKQ